MEEEDNKRSEELATIEKVRWLGNQLVPGLRLTIDLPELHESKKCPMLDIQVWAQETEDGEPASPETRPWSSQETRGSPMRRQPLPPSQRPKGLQPAA